MDASGGFEDWLRERALPPPRAAFREGLRERFLGLPARTSESASQDPDAGRKGNVPDFETFLRERAPPPRPREAFRAELRERFLIGAAGVDRADVADRTVRRPGRPRLRLLPVLVGLAAAAALVAILVPRLRGPATPWRVEGVEGVDGATVVSVASSGERISPRNGTIDLSDLLEHPAEFAVEGGRLRLAYADEFLLEVRPGTHVVLAPDGGRALSLPQGEIFLKTYPGYGGSGLDVDTPQAQVAVHGTTLGVRADAMGTCVCVVEGTVELRELARGQDVVVPQSSSHLVSADPSMMSKAMPFPHGKAAPGDEEHEHVDRLRAFADSP